MEFCGGGSVSDLVHAADGPIDEDIIAYICAQTLDGLIYLHAMGKVGLQSKPLRDGELPLLNLYLMHRG
jgi:serine/threonine protein kinase